MNIVQFPARANASSVVAMAREFADRVERGDLQGVSHAAIVFATNDGLRAAMWGDAIPTYSIMGMYESGKLMAFAENMNTE